jgi:hypothetical protein
MKNMSWPVTWLLVGILLVVGYVVGQALHLDRKTPTAAPAITTVTSVVAVTPTQFPA